MAAHDAVHGNLHVPTLELRVAEEGRFPCGSSSNTRGSRTERFSVIPYIRGDALGSVLALHGGCKLRRRHGGRSSRETHGRPRLRHGRARCSKGCGGVATYRSRSGRCAVQSQRGAGLAGLEETQQRPGFLLWSTHRAAHRHLQGLAKRTSGVGAASRLCRGGAGTGERSPTAIEQSQELLGALVRTGAQGSAAAGGTLAEHVVHREVAGAGRRGGEVTQCGAHRSAGGGLIHLSVLPKLLLLLLLLLEVRGRGHQMSWRRSIRKPTWEATIRTHRRHGNTIHGHVSIRQGQRWGRGKHPRHSWHALRRWEQTTWGRHESSERMTILTRRSAGRSTVRIRIGKSILWPNGEGKRGISEPWWCRRSGGHLERLRQCR
mmetsp:Transcript_54899/g.96014  ORF Transcript_54899/g.96014 Transcript_54899/m.96014 type:complete len:376 (-) Transcript_54899:750-1877(-)